MLSLRKGPKTACRSHLMLVDHNNSVTVVHCIGFVWQGFGSGGATGVASVRSC